MSSYYERRMAQTRKPRVVEYYFGNLGLSAAESMPPSRLADFHRDTLKEIVTIAYNRCPFYTKKMNEAGVNPNHIRTLKDLCKMPFITKDELRGNPWALLACDKKDVSLVTVSTGTTGGEQIYIPNSWRDYILNDMTPRYPKLFPVDPGDICVDALPYEMSSAGLAFHKTFMDACLATVVAAGKGGAYSTPEKTVKVMKDLRPNIVITTPSWAISIAEAAEQAGFDLTSLNLKKMWLTGEGCSNSFRSRVEKIWGATANMYYGSLECGGIGIECDAHEGYHILQGHAIIEIVNPATGEVLEPGEIGEIVVTCPLRFDTPIIRYRTMDLGYIDTIPCKCGVGAPRLFLRGRLVDQMNILGNSFSPFYLEEFLMRFPELGNWYQFVVRKDRDDYLKIRAELAKGVKPSRELEEKIRSKMEFATGISCKVELLEQMPRTAQKAIRVIYEEG
ncbi:MAG: AMP-binding protein [Clostridia bacterium]|nr:AMP-binding protein [Clostridia bacterium]